MISWFRNKASVRVFTNGNELTLLIYFSIFEPLCYTCSQNGTNFTNNNYRSKQMIFDDKAPLTDKRDFEF